MGIVDLVIGSLSQWQNITITRQPPGGTYQNLVWVPAGPPFTLTAKISIQPLNGEELLNLPEGQRTMAKYKCYTTTPLTTAEQITGQVSDLINFNGLQYEIFSNSQWTYNLQMQHGKYIMMLLNPNLT